MLPITVARLVRPEVFIAHALPFEGFSTLEVLLWGVILVSGFLGAILGLYLLYVNTIVVHHTAFFKIISVGLLMFVVTAPVVFFLSVEFIHGIHGFATLVVAIGLYTLLPAEVTRSAHAEQPSHPNRGVSTRTRSSGDDEDV